MKKIIFTAIVACSLYNVTLGMPTQDTKKEAAVKRLHEVVLKGVKNLETWELSKAAYALTSVSLSTLAVDSASGKIQNEIRRRLEGITVQNVDDSELNNTYSILQAILASQVKALFDCQKYEELRSTILEEKQRRIRRLVDQCDSVELWKLKNALSYGINEAFSKEEERRTIREKIIGAIHQRIRDIADESATADRLLMV